MMNHIQAIMQSAAARRKPIIYKQLKNESKTLEQEALGKMGSIRLEDCEETSLKVNCKVCNITCLNCKSIVIEVEKVSGAIELINCKDAKLETLSITTVVCDRGDANLHLPVPSSPAQSSETSEEKESKAEQEEVPEWEVVSSGSPSINIHCQGEAFKVPFEEVVQGSVTGRCKTVWGTEDGQPVTTPLDMLG